MLGKFPFGSIKPYHPNVRMYDIFMNVRLSIYRQRDINMMNIMGGNYKKLSK